MQMEIFDFEGEKIGNAIEGGRILKELEKARYLHFVREKKGKKICYSNNTQCFYLMDEEAYGEIGKLFNVSVKQIDGIKDQKGFTGFVIALSNECNLKCTYCYGRGGERPEKKADWKAIEAAVEFLANDRKGKPIGFTILSNAEPTADFELLKKTFEYAKKKLKIEKVLLSTNGVINEKTCKWLAENIDSLQVAIDGPPELQDLQRPLTNGKPSSPFVIKTIKRLQSMKKAFLVRASLTKPFLENIEYSTRFFKELGLKQVFVVNMRFIGRGETLERPSVEEMKQGTLKFVELGEHYGIDMQPAIRIEAANFEKSGCNIGHEFVLALDGKIAACPMYTDSVDCEILPGIDELVFGHFDREKEKIVIDEERLSKLRNYLGEVKCGLCDFKLCWGMCPYINLHDTGNMLIPSNYYCRVASERFRELVKYEVEKKFFKKKPCLMEKSGKPFYSMYYNEFEMHKTELNGTFSKNPFISVPFPTEKKTLEKLEKKIIKFHEQNPKTLPLFLLSFDFKKKGSERDLERLGKFFDSLKEKNIFFKITKPLRPFFPGKLSQEIEALEKKHRIPKNCRECIELFKVRENGKIKFCNGLQGENFEEFEDRDSIYGFYCKNSEKKQGNCFNENLFNH